MFCGECGTQNPDTNQFCRNCGKPLSRQQPAAQSAVPSTPAPVAPVPQPVIAAAPAPIPAPAPAAAPKRTRNWLGIVSLVFGILSWGVLTVILAIVAILLGSAGTFLFRKATGRIGISGIIGIVLGIAAIAVNIMLA